MTETRAPAQTRPTTPCNDGAAVSERNATSSSPTRRERAASPGRTTQASQGQQRTEQPTPPSGPAHQRRVVAVAISLAALGAVRSASADEALPDVPPRFTSLAPDGARSEVDVELTVGRLERPRSYNDASGLHLDAQYVSARGSGGYARLGAVDVTNRIFGGTTALVGTEVGFLQRVRACWGMVTGRVGVSFPTTELASNTWGVDAVVVARRPADWIWLSDGAMLRLGATPTFTRGAWTARVDVGVDSRLAPPTDELAMHYHADVALGVRRGRVGATLEYSLSGATGQFQTVRAHAVTVGGQLQLTRTVVSLRVGTPFETGTFPDIGPLPPGFAFEPFTTPGELIALALGVSVAL